MASMEKRLTIIERPYSLWEYKPKTGCRCPEKKNTEPFVVHVGRAGVSCIFDDEHSVQDKKKMVEALQIEGVEQGRPNYVPRALYDPPTPFLWPA